MNENEEKKVQNQDEEILNPQQSEDVEGGASSIDEAKCQLRIMEISINDYLYFRMKSRQI